jgi:enoyl-CoA hydratase/carnithine racemase
MEKEQVVTLQIVDSIGILTLDAPPGNYLPVPAFISPERFSAWTSNETMKGVIIHGKGRNFSAGADLSSMLKAASLPGEPQELLNQGHRLLQTIEELELPVIAAINGVCFGGGLEIALACHIRIASEKSLFAFPETNRDLIPGMGGPFRFSALTSRADTIISVLGGDIINAHDALKMGFIDLVTLHDPFSKAMEHMVKMTRDKSVKVIRYAMKSINNARKLSYSDAANAESEMFCELALDEVYRRNQLGEIL